MNENLKAKFEEILENKSTDDYSDGADGLKFYILDLMQQAYELALNDAWISVDGRLPEKEGRVIAITSYEKVITAYYLFLSKEWDADGFDSNPQKLDFITHWQPLPKLPVSR